MHHSSHNIKKSLLLSLALLSLMFGLTACSMDFIKKDPLAFLTDDDKTATPPPPSGAPPKPTPDPLTMEPKPSMLGTMGLNLDTYFAENTKNRDDRFARLEKVVTALHKDLKTLAPPVGRFVAKEEELDKHLTAYPLVPIEQPSPQATISPYPQDKMQPATVMAKSSGSAAAPPQSITTKTIKSVPPAGSTPKPAPAGGITVTDLRTGVHKDKVRIVLDVSGKTGFSADLDNSENILVVDLQDAGWSTRSEKNFSRKTPVLQSYKADPNGKGTLLALQLKQSSSILYQKALAAASGPGQRIVIDLKR